jgi:hypothetical protein
MQEQGYADDRHNDPKLALTVWEALAGRKLREAPFFAPDIWSFCESEVFNIAGGLPEKYAEVLASPEAHAAASEIETSRWCSALRNALAHGGIAYLNGDGRDTYEAPVSMYLFASGRYQREDDQPKLVGLNLLRIKEVEYRNFLRSWVEWLSQSGLEELLEEA